MEVTLRGKTAIVTGAASGIGLATVLRYLEAHVAGVVAVDVAVELPEPLARHPESGGRLRYVRGDVGVERTAAEFTQVAVQTWGRIDVLVNNAGVSVVKAIHEHTPEEWDTVMNTNVKAAYWAARHVIPVMMRQRSGVVLNTGSISGVAGIVTQGAYGPSKGAIHQTDAADGGRVRPVGHPRERDLLRHGGHADRPPLGGRVRRPGEVLGDAAGRTPDRADRVGRTRWRRSSRTWRATWRASSPARRS